MHTLKSNNKKNIAICLGDPGGIGPEVTSKALGFIKSSSNQFLIYGSQSALDKYFRKPAKNITLISNTKHNPRLIEGKSTSQNAAAAFESLNNAIKSIKNESANALVTAPLSKESICKISSKFQGHTEYLANQFKIKSVGMLFVAEKMRTIIVTRHIALKKVSSQLTLKNILQTIELTNKSLKKNFKIQKPRIALCGLNPHAGENGLMGDEEKKVIIPAIKQSVKKGINATGPFPADTLFESKNRSKFDVIIAMYHDQGLIPIKTLYFDQLVNMTIGLPFVRTCPAHGTAFDIAGKNKARYTSMLQSIKLACQLQTSR